MSVDLFTAPKANIICSCDLLVDTPASGIGKFDVVVELPRKKSYSSSICTSSDSESEEGPEEEEDERAVRTKVSSLKSDRTGSDLEKESRF